MAKYPGFPGPSYTLANILAANDRTYNWFPSKVEYGTGPASYVLDCAPGFALPVFGSSGGASGHPNRGSFTLNGTWWSVITTTGSAATNTSIIIQSINSGTAYQSAAVGISNPDDSIVSIAGNGNDPNLSQLMIASAGSLYCFEIPPSYVGGTLTLIPGITATSVVYIGGYFVALDPTTSTITVSDFNNGLIWPGDSAQRNDSGDKWQTMLVAHKEIVLFGETTISIYYQTDDAFPFIPNPSVSITGGIGAPNSAQSMNDGSPIWFANDGTVRLMQGYVPQRVSTFAFEQEIAGYTVTNDADAFAYTSRGHEFYVLNFPTADKTWVYDRTMGLWHQVGPWNGLDYGILQVRGCIRFGDTNLVGSRASGALYDYTQDSVMDLDETGVISETVSLRRERRAPHLIDELKRIGYDKFQVHLEVGLGKAFAQGVAPQAFDESFEPQVMLRWSDDGGQTWSNVLTAGAGKTGEFQTQVEWYRLGTARDRIFEVSCADPIPWRVVDAYLDYRVGAS